MNHILLVAAREFRQIASTRSFWVTLLILPLALAVGPLASRFMGATRTETVMIVDQSGGAAAAAIRDRLRFDDARDAMAELSRYAQRHELSGRVRGEVWAEQGRWFTDADVARFLAGGGVPAAERRLKAAAGENLPGYDRPEPRYRIVDAAPAIAATSPARMDAALAPYLRPADGSDRKPLDYAVLIPADFGRSPAVRLWANGQPRPNFVATLQSVLTGELRARYLQAAGVAPAAAATASAIAPAIAVTTPPEGSGRERVLIRSVLPLGAAYILLMSLILSGSWMLQGSVEERSNKLIESVLACVSPGELMYGKLVGTVAIGLSMVATWVVCGLFAAYATHGAIADLIRPALDPVSSVGSVATIVYFFVAGYVMVSMIFLTIGAMSDSMRDAQGYLTPVILVILMPFTLLMQAVLSGTGGVGVQVLTWIPLYTPFAVLARLGSGISAAEVIGAGLVLALFVAAEVVLLGRVFRASLLNAGARPKLGQLLGMMRAR